MRELIIYTTLSTYQQQHTLRSWVNDNRNNFEHLTKLIHCQSESDRVTNSEVTKEGIRKKFINRSMLILKECDARLRRYEVQLDGSYPKLYSSKADRH